MEIRAKRDRILLSDAVVAALTSAGATREIGLFQVHDERATMTGTIFPGTIALIRLASTGIRLTSIYMLR
jgi:hypothetical protein